MRAATVTRLFVAFAILVPFFWFFGEVLFGGQMFAYRDTAYYYYPLFKWTAQEWAQGRIPLWNPQENFGMPVLADGTSSVLYPGKLLFALPLDFATCFKLYITGHVLLAAAGAYLLARRWKASHLAAGLCAIAYAYSGNVLFQYCNVVFLVGAAWLPFALLAADRMLVERRVMWALILAAILALMVLGGDPQCAYHAGLLAALYAWMLRRNDKRQRKENPPAEEPALGKRWPVRLLSHRFVLLGIAAIAGGVFAAVQILPSLELTRRSQRAAYTKPRTIYEGGSTQDRRDGLLGRPTGGHHEHIYQFSVEPWRVAEFVWPNCSGRTFPINRRWTSAIPGGDRVWTPTMYIGLLPFVLALVAWRFRRGTVDQRFITWTVILAALAALGWYGIGWIVHELRTTITGADPNDPVIGEPVGGLYWLLVTFLPGYVNFRYPAKLMLIATLGLSVLAARGWDEAFTARLKKLNWALVVILVLSLFGTAIMIFVQHSPASDGSGESVWTQSLKKYFPVFGHQRPVDNVFGPLDESGAANDLISSLLQAALLSAVFLMLFWQFHRGTLRIRIATPFVFLAITIADLIVAQSWTVINAPQAIWQTKSPVSREICRQLASGKGKQPIRIGRNHIGWHEEWHRTRSASRHVELAQWQRATLFPKFHLLDDLANTESPSSIAPQDLELFAAPGYSRYWIGWGPSSPNPNNAFAELDISLDRRDQKYSRIQIIPAENIRWMPSLVENSTEQMRKRTEEITRFSEHRFFRDLRKEAFVETDEVPKLPEVRDDDVAPPKNASRIVASEPRRVEIDAELASNGIVILNDFFYPGWTVKVIPDGNETAAFHPPILRTNRVMRGVYLSAGKYRLIYRYEPMSFRVGAIVSAVGWLAVGFGLVAFVLVKRRRSTRQRSKVAPDSGSQPSALGSQSA